MSDINEMNVGVRWYVAHTYSGYENKVKASLEKIVENRGLGDLIFEAKIPVETVLEKKGDVEKEVEYKLFPGYVLVKMIVTDESWFIVRNIRGVTGFVGPASKPVPLSDEEVTKLGIGSKTVEVKYVNGEASSEKIKSFSYKNADTKKYSEIKAVSDLNSAHESQLVNYLTATNIDNGLLINFGAERLEVKRKYRVYKDTTSDKIIGYKRY